MNQTNVANIPEELQTRISDILFYKWDPLNLSNSNWPKYEYDSYVAEVFRLSYERDDCSELTAYLTKLATEHMACARNEQHDKAVAKLLLSVVNDTDYYPDHAVIEVNNGDDSEVADLDALDMDKLNSIVSLQKSLSLSHEEIERYFAWLEQFPFEVRSDGVSVEFELLPGLGEKVTVRLGGKELVLRDYL